MLLLLGFAFVSGLVTILAPCIWPLLPIVLAASATGKSHTRPLGVTVGILLSFAVFTLAISSLVKLFHFDPNILRLFAVVFIGLLGISLLFPSFSASLEVLISRLSGKFGSTKNTKNDFRGGFITGLTLGIVWSPCAGPILAAIATLAATGQVSTFLVLVTFSYVLGVGIPLFIFAYGGQRFFNQTKFISRHTGRVQQVFGVIMILTALAIYTNYDKVIQANLLNAFPEFSTNLNAFESSDVVQKQLNALKGTGSQTPQVDNGGLLNTNYPAPEFTGITHWLNAEKPLTLSQLRGKVILVDFWTYTCINCIRTLPFVTKWYDKYKDEGFVVIGVHSPEFEFEKDMQNVKNAIAQYDIHYPVAQDNNLATWTAYNNEYWPAEYLIDSNGNVRRTHFGEGEYDQTEMAIKALLKEAGKKVDSSLVKVQDQTPTDLQMTPETYVGLNRMERFDSPQTPVPGLQNYTLPSIMLEHGFGFSGKWNETGEYAEPQKQAGLNFHFTAQKVYLVISPKSSEARVKVLLDDNPISAEDSGEDVKNSYIQLDHQRLYSLVNLPQVGTHMLRLEFENGGVQLFAFTFG